VPQWPVRRRLLPLLVAAAMAGCASGAATAPEAQLQGQRLEVLATWSGAEQQRFGAVLADFSRRTGAVVRYTSTQHRIAEVLDQRLAAGRPPDVAFLPQPGLLRSYAAAGRLTALDRATEELVAAHFPASLRRLASYGGRAYGVWFKVANKSLIWYDVATFERLGEVPPATLDGLVALADRLAAQGVPAFAVSADDGWTLTDWFENLYLRVAGPAAYDALAEHRVPWTDATVVETLQLMARLLSPQHLYGGVAGAARTGYEASVVQVFGSPSRAAMVSEGDFVAGVVAAQTPSLLGAEADAFAFPAGPDASPAVVGGGDVAVLMRPSAAGRALLRYLATGPAAQVWAAKGGFVSPNLDVDLASYPDDLTRRIARRLLEAGEDFRFDLSDLQPPAFGGSDSVGLRAELVVFLTARDPIATSVALERAASAAHAGAS
jgi:ABC-type glycerol-3-phosphate transport system substrate-binding protein